MDWCRLELIAFWPAAGGLQALHSMTSSCFRTPFASLAAAAIAIAVLGGLPGQAAAQKSGRAGTYYDDAVARYERKDAAGAIVQLKNALREDPGHLPALALIGRAQLETGDPAGAEEAFTKALQLGIDRSEVAVPMAQALFDQGKYEALLERFPVDSFPPAKRTDLYLLRGHAQKGLGDTKSALRTFEEARRIDPRSAPVLLSYAELLAEVGRRAEAAKIADEAIAAAPDMARLWTLKGSLALAAGDVDGALAAFDRALAANPKQADARVARVSLLIDLGREAAVESDLAVLKREAPDDPRANYLRAVYLGKRGNPAGARENLVAVATVVDAMPRDQLLRRMPQLLLLCGVAHYSLGNNEKARTCLQDLLRVTPNHVGARRVLGSVLLAQGDARGAIAALEPAAAAAPGDAETLALLASAYLAQRRYQAANEYLEKALAASGGASDIHATLGLSLLGAGRSDVGIGHLEQALRKDPGQLRAGFPLAVLYLKRGRTREAVAVAESVVKREPGNAAALNLLGTARAAAGDGAGARAAFAKAIEADQSFAAPQLNLAKLDLQEAKLDEARSRLQRFLRDRPKNTPAMLELAAVEERAGRMEEAVRWLERARAIERRNVAIADRLAGIYIRQRAPEKALEIAKQMEADAPENLHALATLGRAYLALGNDKEAQTVFGRMTRLASSDPQWQTDIARFQLLAKNPQGAAYSLEKALAAKPDHLPAQVLLTEVELRGGETAKAEKRAKAIVGAYPVRPEGYRLQADVAMTRKNHAEAIAGYQTALGKDASTVNAMRLYQALVQSGDARAATRFVESWVTMHTRDSVAQRALAEAYAREGNASGARAAYEQVLRLEGDDAAVLNNLANILASQGDKRAFELAERAHRLAPRDAAVQDTLGWILVQQGQLDAGLRHLREARLRAPDNPEIRYHLASALARFGRRDEARRELEPALRDGIAFEGQSEAKKLSRELAVR